MYNVDQIVSKKVYNAFLRHFVAFRRHQRECISILKNILE